MDQIFETLILTPFTWILNTLYDLFNSYGLALIFVAVIVKVILLYFSARGKKAMMQQQRLQPKMAALQKQYGSDKAKYQQAVSELYQKEGVSMTGGCLWSLLPMPFLFAFYAVLREPMSRMMSIPAADVNTASAVVGYFNTANDTYFQLKAAQEVHLNFPLVSSQFPMATDVDFSFLGLNLAQVPTLSFDWIILIPILSGATAFLASHFSQKFSGTQAPQGNMRSMQIMMPLMSVYFGFIMPAGLGLYWIVQNLLNIAQDYFLTKHYRQKFDEADAKKAALEERRRAAEEALKAEQRAAKALEIEDRKNARKGKTYRVQGNPGQQQRIPKKAETIPEEPAVPTEAPAEPETPPAATPPGSAKKKSKKQDIPWHQQGPRL